MTRVELVTIERVGNHFKAILWGDRLARLASAAGPTPVAALRNAEGVLARTDANRAPARRDRRGPRR